MLVLSRCKGESVELSGPCIIHVIRIGPNSVRLAFECPPETIVRRRELPPLSAEVQAQITASRQMGLIHYQDIPPC